MREVKDTKRATVRIGYSGKVHKTYRGPYAKERYENEVRMLKLLEKNGCAFVPQLLEENPEKLHIVTSNCGMIANGINETKVKKIYEELEEFGVRHEDPFDRNITYSAQLGRFCVIDFEFAIDLETGEGLKLEDTEK